MQTTVKTKKPRKQAISGCFWAKRTYRGRIKDDHKIDPACGTGGMLIEAIRYINNDHMTYGRIFGQEKNLSTAAIAKMNLFLHGARDFKITQGDTLRRPNYTDHDRLKKFNCVLANPPFSLKKWGASAFESDKYGRNIWGTPSDSNADFAWLQHMVCSMDQKDGRCAVVLPQGVLFHGGNEKSMRQQLVESDLLECIVTLVNGLFYSTSVSACILLLNRNKKSTRTGKVILINADEIFTAKRAQNIMTDIDVDAVYKLFADYDDVIEKSKVVTIDEIRDNDYTLEPNKYIEDKPIGIVPLPMVMEEYKKGKQRVNTAEKQLKQLLAEGGYINE